MTSQEQLWTHTPLVFSRHLSASLGANVYLKLEAITVFLDDINLQPSQSFKYRGVSLFAQHCKAKHGPNVHLVIASSGNAGLACACSAKDLGLKCTVFLPEGQSEDVLKVFRREDADVVISGKYYAAAKEAAAKFVEAKEDRVLCPTYEDEILWEGHSSMIPETKQDLGSVVPDAIVCSVGGGGLLAGVMRGCEREGWDNIPIAGVETHGSNVFYQSLAANHGRFTEDSSHTRVTIHADEENDLVYAHFPDGPKSRASSLGASTPGHAIVRKALDYKGGILSISVSDEMAMQTLVDFVADHKILVELACSASLSVAYNRELFYQVIPPSPSGRRKTVVLIVCGGFKISRAELEEYRRLAKEDVSQVWSVCVDGRKVEVPKYREATTLSADSWLE